jgi:hypothetical protein
MSTEIIAVCTHKLQETHHAHMRINAKQNSLRTSTTNTLRANPFNMPYCGHMQTHVHAPLQPTGDETQNAQPCLVIISQKLQPQQSKLNNIWPTNDKHTTLWLIWPFN